MRAKELTFAAPWEARIFATMVHLNARDCISWPDFTAALARAVAANRARPYYESWLAAAEEILDNSGLLRAPELDKAVEMLVHSSSH